MTTRHNGLEARSYTPLTALASHSADAVLDALRQAGVAAYVVSPERGVVNRVVLWVDSGATARAREVLSGHEPLPPGPPPVDAGGRAGTGRDGDGSGHVDRPLDEDALWRAIVASFDTPPPDTEPRWPEAEDIAEDVDESAEGAGDEPDQGRVLRRIDRGTPPKPAGAPPQRGENTGTEGRDVSEGGEGSDRTDRGTGRHDEDADDHFVPPPPPPLPRADGVTRWAWAGLLGGPIVLFVSAVLGQQLADWLVLAALGAFVAGFVTLVARMKDRPPPDSGGDDGAVV